MQLTESYAVKKKKKIKKCNKFFFFSYYFYFKKLVEVFDQEKSPIKFYFMEKMKNSITNQESLKLLQK